MKLFPAKQFPNVVYRTMTRLIGKVLPKYTMHRSWIMPVLLEVLSEKLNEILGIVTIYLRSFLIIAYEIHRVLFF